MPSMRGMFTSVTTASKRWVLATSSAAWPSSASRTLKPPPVRAKATICRMEVESSTISRFLDIVAGFCWKLKGEVGMGSGRGRVDAEALGERELARGVGEHRRCAGHDGREAKRGAFAHEGMEHLQPGRVHALDGIAGERKRFGVLQVRAQRGLQVGDVFDAEVGG